MDPFERKLFRVLKKEPCVAHTQSLIVAISGGPDSVALLAGLCQLSSQFGVEIQAGHVNHGLRGQESEDDQRFVAGLCEALGVRLTVPRLEGMTVEGGNLEERLRVQRYRLLEELAAAQGGVVATAHHADDQAETLLLKLARGAGLRGLSGDLSQASGPGRPRARDPATLELSKKGDSRLPGTPQDDVPDRYQQPLDSPRPQLGQAGAAPPYGGTPKSPVD